jgi:TatD DNase family protein
VQRVLIPAVDLDTSRAITQLCATNDTLFGAVGIHPNSTGNFDEYMLGEIKTLAGQMHIVAIGEIGLDYYRDRSPKESQQRAFEAQLALAARLGLPVIIHNREAHEDVMAALESWARDLPPALRERPGVLHSFSAPQSVAERALAAGFYLGFTGPTTYKNADDLRHIAARVPPERILVETDGPYLTPHPHRGKRNEPAYIPLIVERLAALHLTSTDEMARQTTENAERLFHLPRAQA